MKRFALLATSAFALAACQDATQPYAPTAADPAAAAPLFAAEQGSAVANSYIVVVKEGADPRSVAAVAGVSPRYLYLNALNGFAGTLSAGQLNALQHNPNVAYMEQDQRMHAVATQSNATWGLDRVDQRDLPLSSSYTYAATGAGVNAYIVDTGIRTTHSEFGGRAVHGYDAVDNDFDATDCNGHGTHVAGTVAGTTYGVAKGVKLYGVRVLDCNGSGTNAGVIAGVDWVTANHVKPAVANMSLGGGASTALDDAVRNSIAAGVTYGLAAGNGDRLGRPADACLGSPSRVLEGLTVGATSNTDTEASFSNYGTCVDILAPGVSITSAWFQSDTQLNTISGTSMATPHVVGVAALYLEGNSGATPSQVASALTSNASQNKITLHSKSSSGGTPNLLLYMGFIGGSGGGTPPPANIAPTASFTYSCTELVCNFDGTGSSDSDGSISSYAWAFGDGTTATGSTATHSYTAAGTFTVTLTVTDNAGATGSSSKSVSVTAPVAAGINLSANGYKDKGRWTTDLSWTGATSTNVDVYRDGAKVATTNNDGAYTDATSIKGGGSLTYKVCEAGTSTCSNNTTVYF